MYKSKGTNQELSPSVQQMKPHSHITLQFITMPGTDEKLRLVPVVSTILKLSPEEIKAVQQSINGESVSSGERKTFILTP